MSHPALHPRRAPRVGFLVLAFPSRTETFVRNQIAGLSARGFEVEVIARDPPPTVAGDLPHPVHQLEVPLGRFRRALEALVRLARHFPRAPASFLRILALRLADRTTPFVDATLTAVFLLTSGRTYDVLHAQFGQLGPVAAVLRAAGVHRGTVVTSFRGFDLSEFLREQGSGIYDRLFKEGDLFLPVCESFAERLRGLSCDPRRIVVHRSGIDLSRFPFAPPALDPDGPLRLLSVGRLVPKKGLEYAIRAVGLLADADVTLTVVGDGPLRAELESLVHRSGLADRVALLGDTTPEEVRRLLTRSHLFLSLSVTSGAGDQEGIPNALKEAMATGLPVIGTRHSGIPELIEDGVSGFLVPERDAAAAAERIRRLAEHPERWAEIGAAARRRIVAEYDEAVLNDTLADLYHGLIERVRGR